MKNVVVGSTTMQGRPHENRTVDQEFAKNEIDAMFRNQHPCGYILPPKTHGVKPHTIFTSRCPLPGTTKDVMEQSRQSYAAPTQAHDLNTHSLFILVVGPEEDMSLSKEDLG